MAVFAHGVLRYENYTMVFDQTLFVFEKALRDRFMDVHQGTVTLIDSEGNDQRIEVSRYEQVVDFLNRQRLPPRRRR